jgi:hypothetical protein
VLIFSSLGLYIFRQYPITLGMRKQTPLSSSTFRTLYSRLLPPTRVRRIFKLCGPVRRRPWCLSQVELIMSLVWHVLQNAGSLAENAAVLTRKKISDAALSQRRAVLPWQVFESILECALRPRAKLREHPEAFYQGLRLCGTDGTRFSVPNTPQNKKAMIKATSRRSKAAFAQVGVVTLVELGLHNPIGAAIGAAGESEMALAERLIDQLPEGSLWISDRYYGLPSVVMRIGEVYPKGGREFLLRVRSNLKARGVEVCQDGSALVEIRQGKQVRLVREIVGRVRRGRGKWSTVRLWTSLLDWRRYPAGELLALYSRRWEQEIFYKELKVDMRSSLLVRSQTPETAAQEIVALILAYAVLVDERIKAAKMGGVTVLRISFAKTLHLVRGLWNFLEVCEGILTAEQVAKVVRRTLRLIAQRAIPKRRPRSCPRQLRQPVSSWPRLLRNTYQKGPAQYEIIAATA